jgi:hypothetical protein
MKLWDTPYERLVAEWSRRTSKFTDEAALRALCLADRYFLLVWACKRHDALHPWVYARCREVERNPDDMLDLWARYHFKSSIITFGGHAAGDPARPEITACIFSHTGADARRSTASRSSASSRRTTSEGALPGHPLGGSA